MGLFKKKKSSEKATSDMAGYRPDREWWPDLTAYRKAILLHNITLSEVDALIKEYAGLWKDDSQVVCDFLYTSLPDDEAWIYLEFPNFENAPHYINFWNYQDLLVWFSQKTDREFCLAIPRDQHAPLFLSTMDRNNPHGDSCVGIYADRDFYFEIPANLFEWGPVPTSAFDYMGFLRDTFQFDTRWIPKVSQCKWERTRITLTYSV